MKIVFLVHRYWPHVGGVEKYVHELAKALLDMGHQVDVVAGATREKLPAREIHEGVRVHRFPALRSPIRAHFWFLHNINLFRKADVIHVSNTHMLEYYWRMIGFMMDRRKVFLTRHGMSYIHPVPEWERRRAIRSLALAAGVVHDGEFITKWLGVTPDLCPDQGLLPLADEIEPQTEPPPTSAVFIGRLEPDSGIHTYLDGVGILTRELNRRFELHVYGGGSLADDLRNRVERENLPVFFHGRTPDAQDRISESCFAFIDGRMAIQEAMARKRLVVAAYVDPLKRDYVCSESFSRHIVAVANGKELAEKVNDYIEHPQERAALVAEAFEQARALTWHRTAEAYLGLWRERLSSPRLRESKWKTLKIVWRLGREANRPKEVWALGSVVPGGAPVVSNG